MCTQHPATFLPRMNWFPSALAPAGVLVTLLVWAASASGALTINLNFNQAASESREFDPTGAGLVSLFAEAASRYEDIIYDSHTIMINYWYEELGGQTAGSHELVSQGANPWREGEGNIRIDTLDPDGVERNWFIDGSPDDDGEFAMGQVLYRDLSPAAQARQFNGATPDVFEAAYYGVATDPAAMGRIDMLTVILHEIGHALGMHSSNEATLAETADGDYDVDPGFVGGASMAVNHAPAGNIAHLAGADMLMRPAWSTGRRRLPSQADLFSMAAGHDYGIVFPPRQDYLGGWEFTDPDNWIGVGINHLAHAYVRRNGGGAYLKEWSEVGGWGATSSRRRAVGVSPPKLSGQWARPNGSPGCRSGDVDINRVLSPHHLSPHVVASTGLSRARAFLVTFLSRNGIGT